MQLGFNILDWQLWAPELDTLSSMVTTGTQAPLASAGQSAMIAQRVSAVTPAVQFIDPMVRRRLSTYGRASLACLNDLQSRCQAALSMPMVFASRHGDLTRTVEMLEAIARQEPLSPTNFGLTVHNAVAGLAAIIKANQQPSVALSAGRDTFWFGLIEAATRSQLADTPHLYLYVDFPVPEIYQGYQDEQETPLALCLLLGAASAKEQTVACNLQGGGRTDSMTGSMAVPLAPHSLGWPSAYLFAKSLIARHGDACDVATTSAATERYEWHWQFSTLGDGATHG
ncbi:beta-ketoacyl synthase chain length factor [Parvibium lacunae]|nr:beta-ketoacyl synthase chain length factor [Parvibium lacunae]